MKTELNLLGKRFNMTSQHRRRKLVVYCYGVLAVSVVSSWLFFHWDVAGTMWVILATIYVGRLLGGGISNDGGLVKPFGSNDAYSRYSRNPNSLWSRWVRWGNPWVADKSIPTNDEREIELRNLHTILHID
ncbi:MAG TPA: hypothetical protein VFU55_07135 [Terracidiphilus sp.]|nr:hypothetical protein [Terracidiphilus sp.]